MHAVDVGVEVGCEQVGWRHDRESAPVAAGVRAARDAPVGRTNRFRRRAAVGASSARRGCRHPLRIAWSQRRLRNVRDEVPHPRVPDLRCGPRRVRTPTHAPGTRADDARFVLGRRTGRRPARRLHERVPPLPKEAPLPTPSPRRTAGVVAPRGAPVHGAVRLHPVEITSPDFRPGLATVAGVGKPVG